jgi:U1 small nuclear ribonucleoprotein
MPPHINILFRARPPLDNVPHPSSERRRNYEGLLNQNENIVEKFETTEPPQYIPTESKRTKKLKAIVERIEKTKFENSKKECKYLNINIFGKEISVFYISEF